MKVPASALSPAATRRLLTAVLLSCIGVMVLLVVDVLAWRGIFGRPAPVRQERAATVDSLAELNDALAEVVERAMPSVVSINVTRRRTVTRSAVHPGRSPEGPERSEQEVTDRGFGSGVIFRPTGHVVTNWHVVSGDLVDISVTLHREDEPRRAVLVDRDENLDIAVLRLEPAFPGETFPALPFGDSDLVKQGHLVLALGNPLNLAETVTVGIISNRSRRISDLLTPFFQTDCVINHGSSGGPLINLQGEIIGINTRLITGLEESAAGQAYGLALTGNEVRDACERLLNRGKPRGYLGLTVDNAPVGYYQRMQEPDSVLVLGVEEGSPAAAAGLRKGDVITALNGVRVRNTVEFFRRMRGLEIGETLTISLLRDGVSVPDVQAVIGDLQRVFALERPETVSLPGGLTVRGLRRAERRKLHLVENLGVLVEDVAPGSPFSGVVRRNDIILNAGSSRTGGASATVGSPEELRGELESLREGGEFMVLRDGAQKRLVFGKF